MKLQKNIFSQFSQCLDSPTGLSGLVIIVCLYATLTSCGKSSFTGSGGFRKPKMVQSELGAGSQNLPGTAIPPNFSDSGRAALSKRFNDFLFAGSGPGSCGLPLANNPCRLGGTPLSCPAEYVNIGSVGDCYRLPANSAISMQCFGNRPLCQRSGKSDPNVVLDIKMVMGSACPDGFVGDPLGSNVLGVVSAPANCDNYSTNSFCKKVAPLTSLPQGSSIVSSIAITGSDSHSDSPEGCPVGFEDVGTAADCSNYTKNNANQCCKGLIRFCQKKEIVN